MSAQGAGQWWHSTAQRSTSNSVLNPTVKGRNEMATATKKTAAKSRDNEFPHPTVEERDVTHGSPEPKSRKLTEAEAKQIDNDPGYSAEQLDHMSEYYGTDKSTVSDTDKKPAKGK